MAETTQPARRKRKPVAPSVIEATATTPMPVVEAPAAETSAAEAEAGQVAAISAPIETVAAHQPATPPAAAPAEPQKETVMTTTETVTQTMNDAQNRTEAFIGDVKARAEGAVAKSAQLVEEMSAFGKGNLEALVESSKIAARGFESLGQDAAAFAKTAFEQQTAAWRQLASVKSPTEFLKVQGELVRQSFDQMVQQGSRQTETVLKLAGEVAQPLSNRFAVAADKMKVAA